MYSKYAIFGTILLLFIFANGCLMEIQEPPPEPDASEEPEPPSTHTGPDYVQIQEIEFTGLLADRTPEIEIHLFDEQGDRFIGCAGAGGALKQVTRADVLYSVKAFFSNRTGNIQFDTIKNRFVYLEVIENGTNACPAAAQPIDDSPSGTDQLIGRSQSFIGSKLERPQVFSFGDVTHLKITAAAVQ